MSVSILATVLDGLDQDGQDRLAYKGGASMELRFGPAARATRDVDALVNVSFDDAFADIAERLATGWEGFPGRIGDRTEITRAGIVPPPQRCTIKLAYKGKSRPSSRGTRRSPWSSAVSRRTVENRRSRSGRGRRHHQNR